MKKYLLQKKWYRKLFSSKTYILVDDKWKDQLDYIDGERILKVEGSYCVQAYCKCKNELIHSGSIQDVLYKYDRTIYVFKCNHCGKKSYRRPDLLPNLMACVWLGNDLAQMGMLE